jgi:hypothetical protein
MTRTSSVGLILLFVCWLGALPLIANKDSYGQDTGACLSSTLTGRNHGAFPEARLSLTETGDNNPIDICSQFQPIPAE